MEHGCQPKPNRNKYHIVVRLNHLLCRKIEFLETEHMRILRTLSLQNMALCDNY